MPVPFCRPITRSRLLLTRTKTVRVGHAAGRSAADRRRSGEGSIYPVKESAGRITGYRGYVWCTKPTGERYRKYVKGKTFRA